MTDKSVSESVIFIANISVIGISVILHIGAPLSHNCDQVCENQPCPRKLHLVRYSTISYVLDNIFSFCKLYKIFHEFLHL